MSFRLSDEERAMRVANVKACVRDVPDFPIPGILFRDITPVLADPGMFEAALSVQMDAIADLAGSIDVVCGIESRGFLFGTPIASKLGVGFVPIRKPGKLPAKTVTQRYSLEYGVDAVEIHEDALSSGQRVLIVDDLLATGGTARAACDLVERLRARVVANLFLIELPALAGRTKLGIRRVESIIAY